MSLSDFCKEAGMRRVLISLLSLSFLVFSAPHSGQNLSIEEVLKNAEANIDAHIEKLKNIMDPPFFARTDSPLNKQIEIAAPRVETIKKLLQTDGFDSPDYSKIMELTTEILLNAPDTQFAQTAHWNIHTYWLVFENPWVARDFLKTYLYKYEADDFMKKEAYDKLSNLAADDREWAEALYFSGKYLEMEPDSYAQLLNKARALVHLGFLEEGKALLHRVANEASDSIQANLAQSSLDELETANFDQDLMAQYKKTVEIMCQIGGAAQYYNLENMKYPQSIKDLFPEFLKELTEKDVWGNEFILKFDADSDLLLIASSGSDGKFEGFDQKGFYIDLPGKDIIIDGVNPIFAPRL